MRPLKEPRGTRMDANQIDPNLQFAYDAGLDDNAYTSTKGICQILEEGSDALGSDQVALAYSVFPELRAG